MPSLLELQNLYHEAMVTELLEATKASRLTWDDESSTQFTASHTGEGLTWQYIVSKTQIGNVSFQYTLDIKRNGALYVSIQSGTMSYTERDSAVKELYETVEVIVLQLDAKLKEALTVLQGITGE